MGGNTKTLNKNHSVPITVGGLDEPIRAELFSVERIEQHAESLAAAQTVTKDPHQGRPLIPRVQENGRVLLESYREIARAIQQESAITPAAEWLVDNFHIVEEQLREIQDDLPSGYYRKLPKLASDHLQGYPRVYGVAWAYVAHTDSHFDPEGLRRFVKAYQRVQPLDIGELWAVAITLRVVLVENLRRLTDRIMQSRAERVDADQLADSLLGAGGQTRIPPETALRRFEKKPLARAFVVQLVQRLRDVDPNIGVVLRWLDQRLAEQGTTADEIVRAEHQEQTAMNVTVRNIIPSMRLMMDFDWHDFVESVSLVDEILRAESNFGELDFATRDTYRHAIEDLSRGSGRKEIEVAEHVVHRIKRAGPSGNGQSPDARYVDPGYYLISTGRLAFERDLGFKVPWKYRLLRLYMHSAAAGYLGSIALITALILSLPLLHERKAGVPAWALVLLGLLAAVPASDLAIALINRLVTDSFGPRMLPRLELRDGVTQQLRTIVVVPSLLTHQEEIEQLVEHLEVHYLANSDGDLRFALLTDWMDAQSESQPGDDELLAVAVDGIARLNKLHGPTPAGDERFVLLHRKRVWNENENKWMGWERKRGKLCELNKLLRGGVDTTFLPLGGRPAQAPAGVQYVITLDADTRLPRGVACRLVGTMAHPLNQPRFSSRDGRVVEGYGIVQPRITHSLAADHERSLYQTLFAGPSGIDPYAFAVSDVYQDLFQEGSFTGKGIYDVDAFEASLACKVPDNTLLSHDLLEGIFTRTALASDIELFEEYPSHYEVAAARQHRWVRGDWQLLPWIFGRPRTASGERRPARIPAIGRWKMVDNLRRSLSAPTAFLALVAACLLPATSPSVWARFILAMIALPAFLSFLVGIDPPRRGISKRSHFRAMLSDLSLGASQTAIAVTMLAYQAWLMSDAIVRTLARVFVTHKHLLEWTTARQAKYSVDLNLVAMYRRMAGGLLLAIAALLVVVYGPHRASAVMLPFILLWLAAPAVAWQISRPPRRMGTEPLTAANARVLRLISRRTWHFFETFITPTDHALPPDNFQEVPKATVAHRTSPTNIGLYLLSTLAAHDLGYLGTSDAVDRLQATLATMSQLELLLGHFYNWYDTLSLLPLEPRYVSSVDSGNLAGHLLALANGCRDLIEQPSFGERSLAGMQDTLELLRETLGKLAETRRTNTVTRKQLSNAIDALANSLELAPTNAAEWAARLIELEARALTVADIAQTTAQERGDSLDSELYVWADAVRTCVESHVRDAQILVPWVRLGPRITIAREQSPEWLAIEPYFQSVPTLADAPERSEEAQRALSAFRAELLKEPTPNTNILARVDALAQALRQSAKDAGVLIRRLTAIMQQAETMFHSMDFTFLFDRTRKQFSIGYRVADSTLDANCYDLLASEARLTSFIAIAKGDVPSSHWFRLGRALTPVGRGSALISWSGSMFEYLMPALMMISPSGSLLNQTYELVVRRQIEYGAERRVPWGISESAYNARDLDLTYQYAAFGVPGLGLKRGLSEDLVIAPYATALAAMIDPNAATQNYADLAAAGGSGTYGFYEALDYTSERVPEGEDVAVVRAYMAHHQGMSLVALSNALNNGSMRARFHAEPMVQASELLLQERTPRDVLVARPRAEEVAATAHVRELVPPVVRRFTSPQELVPRTHLLSNGRYAVMITTAGSGYSRWRNIAVTRWREDVTCDCWGSYVFLRDVQTGQVWSGGYQPSGAEPDGYEANYTEDRAEFVRRDGSLATTLEVVVSPEDDVEVRRVSIANLGTRTREVQVTSYAELVMAPQAADEAHPAFSNLFVETEFVVSAEAILATRRHQSENETPVWVAHVAAVEGESIEDAQFETDRGRFLGRGHPVRDAVSIMDGRPLSNTVGPVLDPVLSLRRTVRIPPGSTARVIYSTIVAPTREEVLDLADKYRDARTWERTLTSAWTQAQVQLHHLGITPDEAHLFQRLANAVVYSDPTLRPSSDLLSRSTLDRSALWSHGISGDLPIVLARIDEAEDMGIIRQLVRAHEYWRMKGLLVDVVILNEKPPSYEQELQGSLDDLVRAHQQRISAEHGEVHGTVFLLRGDLISAQERFLLQSVARVVLLSRHGTLAEQVIRSQRSEPSTRSASRPPRSGKDVEIKLNISGLEFFNGLGGFADDGREYVINLGEGLRTPAPWINVIANPSFGFLVSESGSGYTWSGNSHENQLTPWSNDPVTDSPGEAIFIRDEDTGVVWSPSALPVRDESSSYVARHGQGYSRFQNGAQGIFAELLQFVPTEDPVKISRLSLQNHSERTRRLSVTAFAEWVLGSSRRTTAPHIVTEVDAETNALYARSAWSGEFGGRVAFFDLSGRQTSWSGDRTEFLGRNAVIARPEALRRSGPLSGKVGAGLDPCAALQTLFELRPGESTEIVVFLGQGQSRVEARDLVSRYRSANLDQVLGEVTRQWDDVLGNVQISTPDRSMDILVNRWLLYQTLSCRVWGRAAFYQTSGAYGFRDQLQDVMALTVAKRDVARAHLLRAASRQFIEGDVQHWWHPPSGRGVRTRISDDLLWLPYSVIHFIEVTGELGLLDEVAPFLEGDTLAEGQLESYFQPRVSETRATLFEHCARALDRSLAVGAHGLPLIGTGDWNDGMNRVGQEGKGESVWLGWFLHTILWEFAKIADARGERKRAETWRLHVSALKAALERAGWDGEWYRRAYFDDGTPLGTAADQECRIDSIAQSWGVLSGAAEPARSARAMVAVDEYLVRRPEGLVLVLTPPFDRTAHDPGYIRAYLPGIRENGGQYTHAAAWTVLAFAALSDGDKAAELFRMLNPINRTSSRATVQRYKVEPYAMAGDVYSEAPHVGRGGWTWYTGSAGWLYRGATEWILGLRMRGSVISIDPCVPRNWPSYSMNFRYHSTRYKIVVENPSCVSRGVKTVEMDGNALPNSPNIPLVNDGGDHQIRVVLG
jgi:cyclic beta-1,2-glucan synthetase